MDNLIAAIKATFKRRKTAIALAVPIALTSDFAETKQRNWQAFMKKNNISGEGAPVVMHAVVERLTDFLWPAVKQLHSEERVSMKWEPTEGWVKTS